MEGNSESVGVASPGSVPIHLNGLSFRNFIQRTLMMVYLCHVIDVLTKFSFMYIYILKVSHKP